VELKKAFFFKFKKNSFLKIIFIIFLKFKFLIGALKSLPRVS